MQTSDSLSSTVRSHESGRTLLEYLVGRFTYFDSDQWKAHIDDKRLMVNRVVAKDYVRLTTGDEVLFQYQLAEEPAVETSYRIVHETKDFIVIDKPANLPCHPGGIYRKNTLWTMLMESYPKVTLMNRLDRETSGLLMAALSPAGLHTLDPQRSSIAVEKTYFVLVHGHIQSSIDADGWIARDRNSAIRKKQQFSTSFPDGSQAKSCRTVFEPLCTNARFTLLRATLYSGRTHQIRATLCSLGYPVVGDKIYGLNEEFFLRFTEDSLSVEDREHLILEHQALHSCRLSIAGSGNAVISADLQLHAAPPRDMADFIQHEFSLDLSSDHLVEKLWH